MQGLTIGQTPDPESTEKTAAWFGLFAPQSDFGRMVKGPLSVKGDGSLAIGNLSKSSQESKVDTFYADKGAWIILDQAIKMVKSGKKTLLLTHSNGSKQTIVAKDGLDSITIKTKDLSKHSGIEAYTLNASPLVVKDLHTVKGSSLTSENNSLGTFDEKTTVKEVTKILLDGQKRLAE